MTKVTEAQISVLKNIAGVRKSVRNSGRNVGWNGSVSWVLNGSSVTQSVSALIKSGLVEERISGRLRLTAHGLEVGQ